jgi:hypothetical protein
MDLVADSEELTKILALLLNMLYAMIHVLKYRVRLLRLIVLEKNAAVCRVLNSRTTLAHIPVRDTPIYSPLVPFVDRLSPVSLLDTSELTSDAFTH